MRDGKTASARYKELAVNRDSVLKRARECAALTIPSILPPEGHKQTNRMLETYSSFQARCVVHMSNKMLMALFPTSSNFLRIGIKPEILLQAGQDRPDEDTENSLAKLEKIIQSEAERSHWRQPTFVSLQDLIVTGNVLEKVMPDNSIRTFRLDQFVVVRDPSGALLEIVIEENLYPANMPDTLRALVNSDSRQSSNSTTPIPVYTWLVRNNDGSWDVEQEINDKLIPKSKGRFKPGTFPYSALRWTPVIGEDYGRSKCEEHIADLKAYEGYSKSLLEGAAMAARNILGVRPGAGAGVNLKRQLAKARNGDVLTFNEDDVTMLQFQNVPGMQVVQAEIERLRQEIGAAFLLGSSTTRNAERVTAFEISKNIEEIEGVAGGVYSYLAYEMVQRRVERLMVQMIAQGKLPQLDLNLLDMSVTTGIESLGREKDFQKIQIAAATVANFGQQAQLYVDWPTLLGKTFRSLDLPEAVKSQQQVEQEQMRSQAAMSGIDAAAQSATKGQ